jgi:hypothetical protein
MAGRSPRDLLATERHQQEAAARCSSSAASASAPAVPRSEAKRNHTSADEAGNQITEASCTNLHRDHSPGANATSNAQLGSAASCPSGTNSGADPPLLRNAAGATKRPTGLKEALRATALRILPYHQGNFTPSPPPQILDTITDEQILVAFDVVARIAVEAKPKPLSGAAEQRLLAWLIADARGATIVLDPPSAERAGKRLKKQALKVHTDMDAAPVWAEEERARLHAEAAADAALKPSLRAQLAQVDETEKQMLKAPAEEIYVGFYELDQLVPNQAQDGNEHDAKGSTVEGTAELRAPWVLESRPASAPIPPDLAQLLGSEGCDALAAAQCGTLESTDEWWTLGLPATIKYLLNELAAEKRESERLREHADELWQTCRGPGHAEVANHGASQVLAQTDLRVASLEEELLRAQGREQALHEVIRRSRWG